MKKYILYRTHKGKSARWVIKSSEDKPPCACMWENVGEFDSVIDAINARKMLENSD